MLTPAKTDPEHVNEKVRRAKDPESFGAGNAKTAELAKKLDEEATAAAKKGNGQK